MREEVVRADGSTDMRKRGDLSDREINMIEKFIKENYLENESVGDCPQVTHEK